MPAERSRGSRRSGADGNQLVWTMPVEPAASSGIAFATNVTPITFNEPMTDKEDVFLSAEDPSSPRRAAHSKKKPDNHIPRPPNAFILFRSSFIKSQHVSTEVETNHSTLSKIIGLTWQNLPENERQVWHTKAKQALDDHKRKFPQYAFRPLHSKGKGGTEKRKVREVGPKDLKRCAKIAELLVEGKKGQELDAAIQEFDKHHVPEIVTRFEAPITEETFQRPLSTGADGIDLEEDDTETRANSLSPPPSRSRSPSKGLSRSSSSCSISRRSKRSESPGPPPPLVDPPEYAEAPHYGIGAGPITAIDDSYSFSSKPNPSFVRVRSLASLAPFYQDSGPNSPADSRSPQDINTLPFDHSPSPSSYSAPLTMDPLAPQESFGTSMPAIFGDTSSALLRRPSLTINTSLPSEPMPSAVHSWPHPLSPMSSSTDSLNIPATPGYPESSTYPSYDPYVPYSALHTPQLSHSPSLSAASSYEDLSSMMPQQCAPPSPACGYPGDGNIYTNDFPIFVQGQDTADAEFIEPYSTLSVPMSPIDADFTPMKGKQGLFQPSLFDLDFSAFGLVGSIQAY
ncbi:hypothetical protein V5O48_001974 [Marasmius crinis-equi]|uniref:HMG box domain-containing protein n=1 Tax=Marasmius crinis-equi TaxID=585013 RepID=A0ABR3FWX5_9AGAR